MDAARALQVAVARADLALCWLMGLPWGRMGLSLLLAAAVIQVYKAVKHGG